jgi:hypothetical protein
MLSSEKEFSSTCPHKHDTTCDRCDDYKGVLRDLRNVLDNESILNRCVFDKNILQNLTSHII